MENPMFRHETDSRSNKLKRKPMFDDRGNLQNGVRLGFEKGFGFHQGPTPPCAQSIDDNKIIYLLGKQIVLYDMLTEVQRVIDHFAQDEDVACFKYYKNIMLDDNIMYALTSPSKTYPVLVLKNFSKGNTLRYPLTHLQKQQNIKALDLVHDSKYIAVLSELQGAQRFSLIEVNSKEVYCSENLYTNVKNMLVPYGNDKVVILYGQNELYLLQLGTEVKPSSLKFSAVLQEKNQKIVQMVSAIQNQPNFYLITDKGHLYFISLCLPQSRVDRWQRQFLGTYKTVDQTGQPVTTNRIPSSICCNEYNVLIGYYHIEQFTLVKVGALNNVSSVEKISFSCPMLHKIVKMTFAQETMAVCVIVQVKDGDRYDLSIPIQSEYLKEKGEIRVPRQTISDHTLPPGKMFPVVFNLLLHDTLVETLRSPIQSILTSTLLVHKILDVCVIPTKKLFLVLSADKKIKAIKYEHIASTSFQRMLAWECTFNHNDQPASLDTHPLTLSVAVAFRDGLKLFNITSQGLRTSNLQFPLKNCECVRYSRYGHKLVAGSLNQLVVINPYENKVINTVQMPSGYLVKDLCFLQKDMFLQGMFANGSTMIMTSQGSKLFQVWNKSQKCLAASFDSVFDIMAVSYPESITKFYRQRGAQQFAVMWTYPYNITKLLIVNEVGSIFMGTSTGKIRVHQWPFTDSMKFTKHFTQIHLHSSAITQLKVTPDFAFLISGAEDGTIFMSRINAVSQGIPVNDPQLLSAFKSTYKNFKTLYYLQNYLGTNSGIESDLHQSIDQLQSDKADFDTEYNDVIATLQIEIDQRLIKEEDRRAQELRQEMTPLEERIDELNHQKLALKNEVGSVMEGKSSECFRLDQQRLKKIRILYAETDQLNDKKSFYIKLYADQLKELGDKQQRDKQFLQNECGDKIQKLLKQCEQAEGAYKHNILTYQELMKEEAIQGEIYKSKMLEQMGTDLQQSKEEGQLLRKRYNKLFHENNNYEDKMKYFQQLGTELNIDIENATKKGQVLYVEQGKLSKLLEGKDRQILEEEKLVKELLSTNINNYMHEEYLKHRKAQLLAKEKYLENQISDLDKKYNTFHDDFATASKKAKDLDTKITSACTSIQKLKEVMKDRQSAAYLRRYKAREVKDILENIYHEEQPEGKAQQKLRQVIQDIQATFEGAGQCEGTTEQAVQKRDYLIKQVVNTNNLRKIDDSIRRTIMVKLNRETVSLTWQVNQLRKEKKTLAIKVKQLQSSIGDVKEPQASKQNCSDGDIVPGNISIIRRQLSKHNSAHKLLPFQAYHQNKTFSKTRHVKDLDESSTQLPSLLKPNVSSMDTSGLFGVEEIDDEIAQ